MKQTDEPIIVEQSFDASIAAVWDAITSADKMKQWFFEQITAFEPVVDFETQFVVQVEDRVYPHFWKITEVIPMKKISYEWHFEGYPGRSVSDFELFEQGKQVLLRLTATVIEAFPENIPEFKRESGVEGWKYFINNRLKKFLE